MSSYRIDERPLRGRELGLAAQVGKRAFFDVGYFGLITRDAFAIRIPKAQGL